MTIEKIDDIIHMIYPKILRYGQKPNIKNIFFCPKWEVPPWCTSDFQTEVFSVDTVCLKATESYPYGLVYSSFGELRLPRALRLCPESTWARHKSTPEDICEQLNDVCESIDPGEDFIDFYWGEISLKSDLDGRYIYSVVPYNIHKKVSPIPVLESYEVDWETKKICKGETGYIFGCADIVFDFELKIRNDIIPNDIETWRGCSQDFNLRLVTKVEPKPSSWDIPHGKLKVFMDNLRKHHNPNDLPIAGIIPTFSKTPLVTHKILEKDNIHIITFTQKGKISDGFAPEQTRLLEDTNNSHEQFEDGLLNADREVST
jgi:hypothetical protein